MSLIVTGTSTGMGKTVVSALILARYGRAFPLAYWKPIQTGAPRDRDARFIRRMVGARAGVLEEVYRLPRPLSPHLAARLAGRTISPERILEAFVTHALEDSRRGLVVEGAGGLLVPLDDHGYLLADLFGELQLPCVLVASSRLGTINHTLLSLEAMRRRRIEVAGVVLSGPPNRENRLAIQRFGKLTTVLEARPIRPMTPGAIAKAARAFDRRGLLRRYFE